MATLIENIAKTKENFRNIRDAINVVGDAVAFEPLTNEPVEEYPARINDATDMYGQSKYDEGYADGKADGGVTMICQRQTHEVITNLRKTKWFRLLSLLST